MMLDVLLDKMNKTKLNLKRDLRRLLVLCLSLTCIAMATGVGFFLWRTSEQAKRSYVINAGVAYASFSVEHRRHPTSVKELSGWMATRQAGMNAEAVKEFNAAFVVASGQEHGLKISSEKLKHLQPKLDVIIERRLKENGFSSGEVEAIRGAN